MPVKNSLSAPPPPYTSPDIGFAPINNEIASRNQFASGNFSPIGIKPEFNGNSFSLVNLDLCGSNNVSTQPSNRTHIAPSAPRPVVVKENNDEEISNLRAFMASTNGTHKVVHVDTSDSNALILLKDAEKGILEDINEVNSTAHTRELAYGGAYSTFNQIDAEIVREEQNSVENVKVCTAKLNKAQREFDVALAASKRGNDEEMNFIEVQKNLSEAKAEHNLYLNLLGWIQLSKQKILAASKVDTEAMQRLGELDFTLCDQDNKQTLDGEYLKQVTELVDWKVEGRLYSAGENELKRLLKNPVIDKTNVDSALLERYRLKRDLIRSSARQVQTTYQEVQKSYAALKTLQKDLETNRKAQSGIQQQSSSHTVDSRQLVGAQQKSKSSWLGNLLCCGSSRRNVQD